MRAAMAGGEVGAREMGGETSWGVGWDGLLGWMGWVGWRLLSSHSHELGTVLRRAAVIGEGHGERDGRGKGAMGRMAGGDDDCERERHAGKKRGEVKPYASLRLGRGRRIGRGHVPPA